MIRPSGQAADIAIVGGGMVGISLALLLARDNPAWRIALVESFALPGAGQTAYQSSFDARTTALAVGSREILRRAGVWTDLEPHLTDIATVHVSDRGHFGGLRLTAAEYGLDSLGYVVENAWLGRALGTQLAAARRSIQTFAPATVERIRPRQQGCDLVLAGDGQPANLSARLVIVADGAQSRLRAQLGIGLDARDYGQTAIVANVLTDRPHLSVAYERFTVRGPVALLPMGESPRSRQSALIWTQSTLEAETCARLPDGEFLAALQQHFGYRQGRFLQVSRRYAYPLALTQAREQVRWSVVVMGNAAHSLHPVAGQGFNLALRDCAALARVLAEGVENGQPLGALGMLQRYLDRQAADQNLTIRLSDGFVHLFSSADPLLSTLRQLGLWGLETLPLAKTLFARQTMGLG